MNTEPGRFCPVCKFKNEPGAVVCAYCGNPLEYKKPEEEATTRQVAGETIDLTQRDEVLKAAHIPAEGISLYLMGNTKPIAVLVEKEFVLGRVIEEKEKMEASKEVIVNLSPFGAFSMGVSRRHVKIRQAKNGYEIIDLDSTNGTWLNELRLVPNKPYPLTSGAQIRLGRMHLFTIYRDVVSKK
jgi:hypothetical protein